MRGVDAVAVAQVPADKRLDRVEQLHQQQGLQQAQTKGQTQGLEGQPEDGPQGTPSEPEPGLGELYGPPGQASRGRSCPRKVPFTRTSAAQASGFSDTQGGLRRLRPHGAIGTLASRFGPLPRPWRAGGRTTNQAPDKSKPPKGALFSSCPTCVLVGRDGQDLLIYGY